MARLFLAVSLLLSLALVVPASNPSRDAAEIRLPSDASSSGPHESVAIPKPATASVGPIPTMEAVPIESIPIEASLIPLRRNFPYDRPIWRRLGRRCHHRGVPRGAIIGYGDDMIVPGKRMRGFASEDEMHRIFVNGRVHRHREEISVEELMKHREMGLPREMRSFPQWHHDEGLRGLVKRFQDFLNHH